MTPDTYQKACLRTEDEFNSTIEYRMKAPSNRRLIHSILGIASEAGEIADTLKKSLIYNQDMDIENIHEECGDLLWYIALCLTSIGSSMEQCMLDNIEKLKIRYPEKFSEALAKERFDKK